MGRGRDRRTSVKRHGTGEREASKVEQWKEEGETKDKNENKLTVFLVDQLLQHATRCANSVSHDTDFSDWLKDPTASTYSPWSRVPVNVTFDTDPSIPVSHTSTKRFRSCVQTKRTYTLRESRRRSTIRHLFVEYPLKGFQHLNLKTTRKSSVLKTKVLFFFCSFAFWCNSMFR